MGKKSKTTEALLSALEKSLDGGILFYDFVNNPHHYAYGSSNLNRYQLYHILHRLKAKGLVETDKNEGKILMKLTTKGRNQLMLEKVLEEDKWDKKWRIVIFDIPEKHRKVRNVFRRKLKEWGLVSWQKSVWVSKKDIADPLRKFIDELGIEDWVLVIVSNDIGIAHKFVDRP